MDLYNGTAPGVRELPDVVIEKVSVGAGDNNCYLLRCRSTGQQLMIAAASEPERLLDLCGGRLDIVVTTHQHWDHWRDALPQVVAATGARTYAGAPDAPAIGVPTDVGLGDGDVITCGGFSLTVIRLTGHTPGSVALLYQDPHGHPHLFTGDSLFPGGVGNTFGDASAFDSLYHDVTTKLFDALPDETWVYPGHGRDTTLGAERPSLAEWRSRGW
ncbi:glyoxylase-like metal-dependent hydrolase (beta-lactamase superfamily II) [Actinokineospora baliensis]|uniref:MBL fold metallo-hydrolase n=1 Tax=Actinokineospora baliensis TaxID=547056 RepID=UPI00195C808A|nr:MBL fold metallo-hydrolase [Actinokineospora baliensis]MBM7774690.1 glyoxylase-like metal-dependent hydrolase (beta-lactamase superfamily II) [Actinokineospora baliensis]